MALPAWRHRHDPRSRQGERDGIDYHFYERDSFLEAAREGRFLEHAEVHGSFYGSPFTPLLEPLEEGATVLLSIDVQGAAQLLERRIPALFIFIEPPDMGELRRRLQGRGSDDPDSIDLRLENAREEMAQKGDYDHSVVNDDLGAFDPGGAGGHRPHDCVPPGARTPALAALRRAARTS
ncbi:MAG: guanylate kinase [Planctomycetota bacterium]